jgi:branched-chain amino acid transport system ATP-binding protein
VRSVFLGESTVQTDGNGRARSPATAARPTPDSASASERRQAFAVVDITRRFGGVTALDMVSFDAVRSEIVGIIGANGAGKTTLFDVCSGFLEPNSGRVLLGDVDVTGLTAHERAELGLGRVFQDARLFPSMTVAETIAVALERHTSIRDPMLSMLRTNPVRESEMAVRRRVNELIENMGLERYRDAFVFELSTGTRRVVELACVLAHDPSVLLLDEPTSGIAQREGEALGQLLVDLRDHTGATFVVIEHDVPLVSSIADRLLCLDLGEVIAEGSPEAVVSDPRVIASYLGADEAAIARSGKARPHTRSGKAHPRTRSGSSRGTTQRRQAPVG